MTQTETPRIISAAQALHCPVPCLVLTDNLTSWVAGRIKAHTHGNYNHAMWVLNPGIVATQDSVFKEAPLGDYLKGKHRVKFWYNPNWGPLQKAAVRAHLMQDVARGGRYDYCGILGQWAASVFHWATLKRLQWPGREFCSEEAVDVLRQVESGIKDAQPSPADLDRICIASPRMKVWGIVDPTL